MKLLLNKGRNFGWVGGNGCPYALPNALLETTLPISPFLHTADLLAYYGSRIAWIGR